MVLVVFGVFLIWNSNTSKNSEKDEQTYSGLIKELENKIEDFLLNVDGIKRVEAIITINTDVKASLDSTSNLMNNSIYSNIIPNVSGIAIACTNGDNYNTKIKITKLLSAYLGLPTNRIEIVNFG